MCNLMHRGGLDNIFQLTLNIYFFFIYYCIPVVNSYIYIRIILICVHCNVHSIHSTAVIYRKIKLITLCLLSIRKK